LRGPTALSTLPGGSHIRRQRPDQPHESDEGIIDVINMQAWGVKLPLVRWTRGVPFSLLNLCGLAS